MPSSAPDAAVLAPEWVIQARHDGMLDRVRELWAYRYLLWFFASNSLQAMYKRSSLGWIWLLLRISGPVGLNTLIFGGVLNVDAPGGIPYFLFLLCGTVTWMLFERAVFFITRSLEKNRKLITKVYFPRLIIPISAVAPALIYVAILIVVLIGAVIALHQSRGIWYISISSRLFVSLLAVVLAMMFGLAVGLWTCVLQTKIRDIRFGVRYLMPFWMLLTPVMYPLSKIPEKYHWAVAINPMAPTVEAFKWGTLGQGTVTVRGMAISLALIALTMISGLWFFNREESAAIDKL
jgi:lipopolysaccharide transport system permease protein